MTETVTTALRREVPAVLAALAALGLALPASPAASQQVEITHVANEGFLLVHGETKVLVDALFPGIPNYPAPGPERLAAMVGGEPPFDGVDLVLATHVHRDHFGPEEVRRFLTAHAGAVFFSTPRAVAELGAARDPELAGGRVRAVLPAEGESVEIELAGVGFTVFNLHHGRDPRPTQNLGFLVDLGGFRVLHVGDTEIAVEELRPLALAERGIDVALVPAWFVDAPRWQGVLAEIGAREIVAMHLATPDAPASWFGTTGSREARVERMRRSHPGVWVAGEPLETRVYGRSPE